MAKAAAETAPEASAGVQTRTRFKRKPASPDPIPKSMTFFSRIEAIPKEDWGTRAKIKIYRLEPMIDRLRGSAYKYIMIYEEPVNEERIKVDHGSGRYRLHLNFKVPAGDEKEIDAIEFDIYDVNFPPKVTRGEWVEDPRNHKWKDIMKKVWDAEDKAAALQAQIPPAPQGPGFLESIHTYDTIRKSVREEMRPADQINPVQTFLDGMKTAQAMQPAPTPAATENTLLTTVMTMVTNQVNAAQQEAKELRQEIREMRNKPADSNGLGAIKELFTEVKAFLPILKDTFPGATEIMGGGLAVRGRGRPQWWETILESPVVADTLKPIGQALGAMMVANATRAPQQPRGAPPVQQPNPAQQIEAQPQPAQPEQRPVGMIDFVFVNRVPLLKHFAMWCDSTDEDAKEAWSGQGLAQWLTDGFGPVWENLSWHQELKTAGVANLLVACQNHPVLQAEIWSKVSSRSQQFQAFLTDLLAWEPDSEDEPEGVPQLNTEPIDLT